ncbi:hypothetical protein HDU96_000068 [Phlyctochytrium bullatum]|nr:hypothetical protein HDU96_000068 [Phlyctochytrium bullatum]
MISFLEKLGAVNVGKPRAGAVGLLVLPVSTDLNWGRQTLSLGIALLNLMVSVGSNAINILQWGISNPFLCAWADSKRTTALILFSGSLLYALGLALLTLAQQIGAPLAILGLGVFAGVATAATGISIVLALIGKRFYSVRGADDRQRLVVFGVVSAVSQLGQFALSPVVQAVIKAYGWRPAVWVMAGLTLAMAPLAALLRDRPPVPPATLESTATVDESPTTSAKLAKGESADFETATQMNSDVHEESTDTSDIKVVMALDRSATQIVVPLNAKTAAVAEDDVKFLVAEKPAEGSGDGISADLKPAAHITAEVAEEVGATEPQQMAFSEPRSLREALQEAFTSSPFYMITFAFFTCGWHIGFISTHLVPEAIDHGVSASNSAWTLSLIGATSTIATASAGYLPRLFRLRVKSVLSLIYFFRAVTVSAFFVVLRYWLGGRRAAGAGEGPGEGAATSVVIVFSVISGFAWLTTVPLTTALLSNIYGTKYLGTLSAITFFSHQVGSFLGSYLGGVEYDRAGAMDGCWIATVVLAFLASLMHLTQDDTPPVRRMGPEVEGAVVGAGVVPADGDVAREEAARRKRWEKWVGRGRR